MSIVIEYFSKCKWFSDTKKCQLQAYEYKAIVDDAKNQAIKFNFPHITKQFEERYS